MWVSNICGSSLIQKPVKIRNDIPQTKQNKRAKQYGFKWPELLRSIKHVPWPLFQACAHWAKGSWTLFPNMQIRTTVAVVIRAVCMNNEKCCKIYFGGLSSDNTYGSENITWKETFAQTWLFCDYFFLLARNTVVKKLY